MLNEEGDGDHPHQVPKVKEGAKHRQWWELPWGRAATSAVIKDCPVPPGGALVTRTANERKPRDFCPPAREAARKCAGHSGMGDTACEKPNQG